MVSLKFLYSILDRLGYMHFDQPVNPLKRFFYILQTSLLILYPVLLTLSTITRAPRYGPELIQQINEVLIMSTISFAAIYLGLSQKKLQALIHYMETKFSRANSEIIGACDRKARLVFNVVLFLVFCAGVGSMIESLLPLSEKGLQIHRHIYRTKYPERRLIYKIKIPMIDESVSPMYEILFGIELYLFVMYCIILSVATTFVPIILIHMCGQFDIIAAYMAGIGREHRDRDGRRIRYTSIERNEFTVENYELESGSKANWARVFRLRKVAAKVSEEAKYQRMYMRQIVIFHQKLIVFQEQLTHLLNPFVFEVIVFNSFVFSLSLYQVVVFPAELSKIRLITYVAEFITVAFEYFLILNCSESADQCHEAMCNAINNCDWTACTIGTRRDLLMILRRVQVPNHLKFYGGTFVPNRDFYLRVWKFGYRFINFMKLIRK